MTRASKPKTVRAAAFTHNNDYSNLAYGAGEEEILRILSRFSCMTTTQIVYHLQTTHHQHPAVTKRKIAILKTQNLIYQPVIRAPYQITERGINAIESELPPPNIDQGVHTLHTHTVVDLVLMFETLGRVDTLTEREMMYEHKVGSFGLLANDQSRDTQTHRPDFLIDYPGGTRIAVEYERSRKQSTRLTRIIKALDKSIAYQNSVYITDPNVTKWVTRHIEEIKPKRVTHITLSEVHEQLQQKTLPNVFNAPTKPVTKTLA
jgi:hypothetical protein